MRRTLRAASALLLLTSLAACGSSPKHAVREDREDRIATSAQVRAHSDAFGIDNVKPTLPGGTLWTSRWNGPPRHFVGVDPKDHWFDAAHGSARFRVADGQLFITGSIPRMYVHDPRMKRQWRNIEATVYFKRVSDTAIPYAGMTIVARSNHLDTESGKHECDTRGYGARMRYDGHVDFEKETAYPLNQAVANHSFWNGALPRDEWVGVKFLVFDRPDGVHLQMYVDLTDGKNGGDWQLANQVVDDGHLFGNESCRQGVNPRMPLTADSHRKGSESGRPNETVYFRSDGVLKDGLVYKWASIREIQDSFHD